MSLYLDEVSINREAIQGQSPGLVAAEDVHSRHFFDGRHPLSDGPLHNKNKRFKFPKTHFSFFP